MKCQECLEFNFHAICVHKSPFLASASKRQSYKAQVTPTEIKSYRLYTLTILLAQSSVYIPQHYSYSSIQMQSHIPFCFVSSVKWSFSCYKQDVTSQECTPLLLNSSSYWLLVSQVFHATAIIQTLLLHTMSKPVTRTRDLLSRFINRVFATSTFFKCSETLAVVRGRHIYFFTSTSLRTTKWKLEDHVLYSKNSF